MDTASPERRAAGLRAPAAALLADLAPAEAALPLLVERLAGFDLGCLENPLFGDSSVRAALDGLADLLQDVADVSNQVSDRLALRHFAHVDDVSQRTVSV